MGPPTADAAAPVEMDPLPTTSPSQQEEPRTVAGAERCSPSVGPESRARSSSHSHPTSSNPKRTPAAEALGTSTDQSISPTPGTSLTIMLLLTTGARHPYTLDEKYVTARQATARTAAGDFDPRELKSYQLKKFIWTDWRQEWEPRPANPSSIRLILMGRMLDDNAALKDYPFRLDGNNVVHMTIKPAELAEDDDHRAATGGNKEHMVAGRDSGGEREAGCRCVVQ